MRPGYLRALHGRRVVAIDYDLCRSSATRRINATRGPATPTSARIVFDRPPRDRLYVMGNAVEPAEFCLPTTDWISRVTVKIAKPLYKLLNGHREWLIEPSDINRLIERDEHASALRELAFWLTVPGPWQVWSDREGGTRFGDRNNVSWPIPVHVYEEPLYRTVERWLELDLDSVAVCADARMERGLPIAPRLTVLGPRCPAECPYMHPGRGRLAKCELPAGHTGEHANGALRWHQALPTR